MDDVRLAITMDWKQAGNFIYQVGLTRNELGGSSFSLVTASTGGRPPEVDAAVSRKTFRALHQAICRRLVRSCHDLSEGGLAVTAAEMALAGGLGGRIDLNCVPHQAEDFPDRITPHLASAVLLFSESNGRFLCEVSPDNADDFEAAMAGVPHARVGRVTDERRLRIAGVVGAPHDGRHRKEPTMEQPLVIDVDVEAIRKTWQAPLAWE
jgi:phosphoribosylformylglycinamidine synthase